MVLVSSSIETEERGKLGMDDTDGQAHAVITLPSFYVFFLSSSFPFHVPSAFCLPRNRLRLEIQDFLS